MNTLISKLGARGDVVRTTVLLNEPSLGKIHWLSKSNAKDLLESKKISEKYFLDKEEDVKKLKRKEFDLILSLDEDENALRILENIPRKRLIGVYLDKSRKTCYTKESSYWFDMSMVSQFGKEKADELKKNNLYSVPEILYEMIGKKFSGQKYDLGIKKKEVKGKVGLINIATGVWPNKFWAGYDALADKLKYEGYIVSFLGMRPTIKHHIGDINDCELIVCGDTLGMHLAIALEKKVVALFNCTPAHEIGEYAGLEKITSPLYEKYFFKREFSPEAVNAIKVGEVFSKVKTLLNL